MKLHSSMRVPQAMTKIFADEKGGLVQLLGLVNKLLLATDLWTSTNQVFNYGDDNPLD